MEEIDITSNASPSLSTADASAPTITPVINNTLSKYRK
jgi:hypothetical protein